LRSGEEDAVVLAEGVPVELMLELGAVLDDDVVAPAPAKLARGGGEVMYMFGLSLEFASSTSEGKGGTRRND
jgi:hypothetical protein